MSSVTKARPFRLTAPVVEETSLQASVADLLALCLPEEVQWTCFPAGSVPLPPEYAAKLARMGLQRGWPDLILVWDGRVYGLELKKVGGVLSKTRLTRTRSGALRQLIGQSDRFPLLIRSGMKIGICHSTDEVLACLRGWGMPIRGVR